MAAATKGRRQPRFETGKRLDSVRQQPIEFPDGITAVLAALIVIEHATMTFVTIADGWQQRRLFVA